MSFYSLLDKIIQSKFSDAGKAYAIELLFKYKEEHGTDLELLKRDTEKVLLSGAKDWPHYARSGLSLIANEDIRVRFSTMYIPEVIKEFPSDILIHLQECYLTDACWIIKRLLRENR